jgi:peptide/nickel transport system permease protein
LCVLFFVLRAAGDPALVLAGPDATPAQVAEIRSQYGLDRSLPVQYLSYLASGLRPDLNKPLTDGTPALCIAALTFERAYSPHRRNAEI